MTKIETIAIVDVPVALLDMPRALWAKLLPREENLSVFVLASVSKLFSHTDDPHSAANDEQEEYTGKEDGELSSPCQSAWSPNVARISGYSPAACAG